MIPKDKGDTLPRAFLRLEKDGKVIEVDFSAVEAMVEHSTSADANPFSFFSPFLLFFSSLVGELPGLTAFKQGSSFPSGPSVVGRLVQKATGSLH